MGVKDTIQNYKEIKKKITSVQMTSYAFQEEWITIERKEKTIERKEKRRENKNTNMKTNQQGKVQCCSYMVKFTILIYDDIYYVIIISPNILCSLSRK